MTKRYKRWLATLELGLLALVTLGGLCLIPGHSHIHFNGGARGLTTTWPIPASYGHYHPVADVLMFIVWILLGIATAVSVMVYLHWLWRQAVASGDG